MTLPIVSFLPLDCGLEHCTWNDLVRPALALTVLVVFVLLILASLGR